MERFYVIYYTDGKDKLLSDILQRMGVEVYNPYIKFERKLSDGRVRVINEPLYPGYMFIRTDRVQDIRRLVQDIRRFPGVRGVLTEDGQPATIDGVVIQEINNDIPKYEATVKKLYGLKIGDEFKIQEGVFRGFNGTFQGYDDSGRKCIVCMRMLGDERIFEIPKADLGL